jgi:hypothetical protein
MPFPGTLLLVVISQLQYHQTNPHTPSFYFRVLGDTVTVHVCRSWLPPLQSVLSLCSILVNTVTCRTEIWSLSTMRIIHSTDMVDWYWYMFFLSIFMLVTSQSYCTFFQNIQDFYFWLQVVACTHPVWTVSWSS